MAVNFEVLQGLVIRYVTLRIRNGDCTERQLARLVGISQPQLHNVLKGARPLKQSLADALLNHFQIGLLDVLREREAALEKDLYGETPHGSIDWADRRRLAVVGAAPRARKAAASEHQIPGQSKRRAS
jgi:transcriptional regulator with XRE-family HTH domain